MCSFVNPQILQYDRWMSIYQIPFVKNDDIRVEKIFKL